LPAAAQVAFATVPLFPFPDESATVAPDPSLNENAATKPDEAANVEAEPDVSTTIVAPRAESATIARRTDARRNRARPLSFGHSPMITPISRRKLTAPAFVVNAGRQDSPNSQ
jgi:hypothetical protein